MASGFFGEALEKSQSHDPSHPGQVIDFLYFCVETGVECTNTYGDIDKEFYMSFEDLFERAAKLVSTNGLVDDYLEQARHMYTFYFSGSDE